MDTLTVEAVRNLPATVDLMTAARILGLGRTKAYDLAKRDRFPCRVLRVGATHAVPTADLQRLLGIDGPSDDQGRSAQPAQVAGGRR